MDIKSIMREAPVIPVLVIDRVEDAVPLAEALVAGGLNVLEVTLRSDVALEAIEKMASALPDAIIGAGTINEAVQMSQTRDAGARFAVSPGFTASLGSAAQECSLPYLPGIMTPGEILLAMEHGLDALKFFPAKQAGGAGFLKTLAGPFPDIRFCPTGGINADTAPDYLELPNVLCVGGSWVAPQAMVRNAQWDEITALARTAGELVKPAS